MAKKLPIRQCAACREKHTKNEMARVVRSPEGEVLFDKTGKAQGRGCYICLRETCLARAVKTRALARALECDIPGHIWDELENAVKEGKNE